MEAPATCHTHTHQTHRHMKNPDPETQNLESALSKHSSLQAEVEDLRLNSKQPLLESLLATFDQNEALRADTKELRPRLENEINAALAGGNALDEKAAAGLQTKRAQLEMIPAKLGQICARSDKLRDAIETEFYSRFKGFDSELQLRQEMIKKKVLDVLSPLMIDPVVTQELFNRTIWTQTKPAVELSGLVSVIQFQVSQQNIVGAARELLKREKELALIKARP